MTRKALLKLRAFYNPMRYRILSALQEHGKTPVYKLQYMFKLDQSAISQHLMVMRKADIVIAERDGKFVYYSLNKEECRRVAEIIRKFNES